MRGGGGDTRTPGNLLLMALAGALVIGESPLADSPAEPAASGAALHRDVFARDTYRIDTFVCPFRDRIDYEPGEIECGLLQVPENREVDDSRFIELHFVKLNSTWDDDNADDDAESGLSPGRRDDPVMYLTGGPGATVGNYVERFKDHRIRRHRDLYVLEQRGIGSSGDFCLNYSARKPESADVETFEEQLDAAVSAAADCARNATAAGVDLSAYNTIENARDVRALRLALGFDQWNVWGISYGTILGQAYLREDPGGIRAIVLDSIVPINARDDTLFWRIANWYDRDLKKLDALCQADSDCAKHYPDLGGRIRQATLSVKDAPIVVDVKDTESYPSGKAHFFTDVVAFLPFTFMYEQSDYPGLPGLIYAWAEAVENREETLFKAIAQADMDFFGGSQGMYNAIFCLDGYAEAQIASGIADLADYPVLSAAIGTVASYRKFAQLCRDVGMPPRDVLEYAPVQTDIPALVVAGDMDPITPPPLAKAILPGFSKATYIEFPYAGHGPTRSVECGGDLLNKFFDKPGTTPDTSCVDEVETPDFFVPLFRTAVVPRLLLMSLEDKKSLVAPAVWGGTAAFVVVAGFFILTWGFIGRRIDKLQAATTYGARGVAWLACICGVLALAVLGAAFAVTFDASEVLPVFGLVPWARIGALAGVLSGLLGIAAIALTARARRKARLPVGTLLGLLLSGAAATALGAFIWYWDLGPF